ncbi:UNVERIFIED_CONTAM: hypothetical protein Sradi_0921200 [Sesamum radiatum]|uniref:Uncharacterized protein n=1 Tax=Sesamum radiatum TaxID=300843 RepID=A0AAW2V2M0_SESRA
MQAAFPQGKTAGLQLGWASALTKNEVLHLPSAGCSLAGKTLAGKTNTSGTRRTSGKQFRAGSFTLCWRWAVAELHFQSKKVAGSW